jgi:hypothetical protein
MEQWIIFGIIIIITTELIVFRNTPWVKKYWEIIVAIIPIVALILEAIKKAPTPVPTNSVVPTPTPISPTPVTQPAPVTPVPVTPAKIVIGLDYQLSPHFNFGMMTTTENRKLLDQNRSEGLAYINNLSKLCNNILEPILTLVGPTYINSAFRCPDLNKAIGGVGKSQHMFAEAADTHYNVSLNEAYNKIAFSNIPFSQIILEFNQWVHVGIIDETLYPGKVGQKLIASRVNNKTVYTPVTSPI